MAQLRSRKAITVATGALSGLILLGGATMLWAQGQGGLLATIGVSNNAFYQNDSSSGDDIARLGTNLTFGLSSETRAHSFSFSTGGQFRLEDGDLDFDNRNGALGYTYRLRSSEVGLQLRYNEVDIDGGTVIDDILIDDAGNITDVSLIADEGTRQNLDARLTLVTGQEMPFGIETTLRFQQVDYQGLISNSFSDRETVEARTALRFDLSPLVTLRLNGSYVETDIEDTAQTLRTTTRAGVGGTFLIDPLWRADVSLEFTQIETETTPMGGGARQTAIRDGFNIGVDVTREFRNGDLRVSYARDVTTIGERDRLFVTRSLTLANGADLQAGLGALTFAGNDSVYPALQLTYAQETRRGGAFSVNLNQAARIQDSLPAIRTSLSANYRHPLSEISSLSVNGSFAAQDVLGTGTGDQQSMEIGIGFNRALTEDWSLSTRVGHRMINQTGVADREISTLSLSLERQFTFRP